MPPLAIHNLLRYSHRDSMGSPCTPILWDLREPPATSVRHISKPNKCIRLSELAQFATSPPVTVLYISCELFPYPWPIEARNSHGVTILDVLEAIYHTTQRRIRPIEWDRMSEKHQERVKGIFHHRWNSSRDPLRERANGVIRADCLLQSTCFAGLSASLEVGYMFIMSLARNTRLQ